MSEQTLKSESRRPAVPPSLRPLEKGVRWSDLIRGAGFAPGRGGANDPLITSVVEDSREARPGACFVARRGTQADGHAFLERAVAAGASAVVCERAVDLPSSVVQLRVENARGLAGRLAAVLHGVDELQRRGRLKLVGITGTNGKSTFCYLLRAILREAGKPAAMLGTVQVDLIGRVFEASMTTPPAATLIGYLAEAARAGATHAVMEVSSHALDQGRCDGLKFDVGVFSNLTGDHLDYHRSMQAYLEAKKRLFDGLDADAAAVINADDPAGEAMVADCRGRVLRYGLSAENVDVAARVASITAAGARFALSVRGGGIGMHLAGARIPSRTLRGGNPFPRAAGTDSGEGGCAASCEIETRLIGRHNVQNCLAAAAAAAALGVPLETIAAGLASIEGVPGRLQRVTPASGVDEPGFVVLVDYAHTDDALANVLSALRPITTGKLIVLFGCGGDRDRTKRPRMARVAEQWADRIVVTSDNPRTEAPGGIIRDILPGFSADARARVRVEPDRRSAIREAIGMAERGDVVLLAGKGHETYQIMGKEQLPFDDAAEAAFWLSQISPSPSPPLPPSASHARDADGERGRGGDGERGETTR